LKGPGGGRGIILAETRQGRKKHQAIRDQRLEDIDSPKAGAPAGLFLLREKIHRLNADQFVPIGKWRSMDFIYEPGSARGQPKFAMSGVPSLLAESGFKQPFPRIIALVRMSYSNG